MDCFVCLNRKIEKRQHVAIKLNDVKQTINKIASDKEKIEEKQNRYLILIIKGG